MNHSISSAVKLILNFRDLSKVPLLPLNNTGAGIENGLEVVERRRIILEESLVVGFYKSLISYVPKCLVCSPFIIGTCSWADISGSSLICNSVLK